MTQPMLAAAAGPQWAFERYQEVRSRLPSARFAANSEHCSSLFELMDRFDAFLFDSFGVLNVGDMPVPGATACIEALRRAGKQVMVLTNAATGSIASLPNKYSQLGFDFTSNEIVSSRQVLAMSLAQPPLVDWQWAIAAPGNVAIEEIVKNYSIVGGRDAGLSDVDGFILLSTSGWNEGHATALRHALRERPRPVLVGNPDLVAPREGGLSLEPGSIAHQLLDEMPGLDVSFFGKPFGNAFEEALRRLLGNVCRDRVAMVGDTLHTDILGGAAAGCGTVLVTDWGVLKGFDIGEAVSRAGIVPDFIVPSI